MEVKFSVIDVTKDNLEKFKTLHSCIFLNITYPRNFFDEALKYDGVNKIAVLKDTGEKVGVLSNINEDDEAKKPKTNSMEHKEDFFSSFDANIKLVKSNTRKVIKDMKLEKNTNT